MTRTRRVELAVAAVACTGLGFALVDWRLLAAGCFALVGVLMIAFSR